jgi:hypothetical protein
VLITDTAFTAPDPGPAQDIAVKAFMAEISFRCWRPVTRPDTPRLPTPHSRVSDLSRAPGD